MYPTYTKTYKDLDLDFTVNPITGDLVTVADARFCKTWYKNILLTENTERLFQPEVGSGIKNLLFEQMSDLTASILEDEVRSAIEAWEGRARFLKLLSHQKMRITDIEWQ